MRAGSRHTPVSSGWQEVDTAVNASVRDSSLPVDIQLLLQVFFILFVDVLYNGLPAEKKRQGMINITINNTCLYLKLM